MLILSFLCKESVFVCFYLIAKKIIKFKVI